MLSVARRRKAPTMKALEILVTIRKLIRCCFFGAQGLADPGGCPADMPSATERALISPYCWVASAAAGTVGGGGGGGLGVNVFVRATSRT